MEDYQGCTRCPTFLYLADSEAHVVSYPHPSRPSHSLRPLLKAYESPYAPLPGERMLIQMPLQEAFFQHPWEAYC
jgi:hypothetical protein